MKIVSIIIAALLTSCGNIKEPSKSSNDSLSKKRKDIRPISIQQEPSSQEEIFIYDNDTISQKVEISYLSGDRIAFKLTSCNKNQNKKSSIEGVALSRNTDPEIDEDEDGNAYPAQQYFFEKGCWLSFRIDMEQRDKLRVIERDCGDHRDKNCPFHSLTVLKKTR